MSSSIPDSPPVVKDDSREYPVPGVWRPMLHELLRRFVDGDYGLSLAVEGVDSISPEAAQHIRDAVEDYGATLVELPDATWETSVVQWQGGFWDVMVDLWTEEEGQSDLVLQGRVTESDRGHRFAVHMVYVP